MVPGHRASPVRPVGRLPPGIYCPSLAVQTTSRVGPLSEAEVLHTSYPDYTLTSAARPSGPDRAADGKRVYK